mmetsp:Transcript_2744/g.6740  ORF Transcript_2744/g.6740 Transcript_2744/m.6740 type:complete len:268 (-) Transcript_2744:59-862(-)
MGCVSTKSVDSRASRRAQFYTIPDRYRTIQEVQLALRAAGLESSQLIVGIDFTKSNNWTGAQSFGGRPLHDTSVLNPYQQCISIVGRTLEVFDDDKLIPAYGFGDLKTTDKLCFPFNPDRRPCCGFQEVLQRYGQIVREVSLAGPTNFGPLIREAVSIVKQEKAYHILVIICDGQVTSRRDTEAAIVEASKYPLSIICIGVGDGPWDMMEEFDDELPQRAFDNFQFVCMNRVMANVPPGTNPDAAFATACLMEIPEQFKLINRLRLL